MGNIGSVHNLNNENVEGELNSYSTQQYLQRTTTGDTQNKNNQVVLGGWSSGRNVADFKVLPKPTENLKLRATTNGAILQAGGTISFRAKELLNDRSNISVLKREDGSTKIKSMTRSQTLILDGQVDLPSHRKSAPPLEFRRSQTLLYVGYNRAKSQENISTNFDVQKTCPSQSPTNNSTLASLKVKKYNKKRKAPPAPMKCVSGNDNRNPEKNSVTKSRIYASNSNKTCLNFQRNSNAQPSANFFRTIQPSTLGYKSKLPYRREKSFDAVLLRQQESNDYNDNKTPIQYTNSLKRRGLSFSQENLAQNAVDRDKNENISRQYVKPNHISSNSIMDYLSKNNYTRDLNKKNGENGYEEPTQLNLSKHETKIEHKLKATNKAKTKIPQSRIPQLQRTFYFGMESSKKSTNLDLFSTHNILCKNEKNAEVIDGDVVILNHNIEAEEEIIDNGILVHVRPTLPKRQPEAPSFSPTAAWRNLLEEQQRLQHARAKPKQNPLSSRKLEIPISLTSNTKEIKPLTAANWTPQQDLEDDDDEENVLQQKYKITTPLDKAEIESENRTNSNPLHLFSLSLPRDVHLQCPMKSSLDYTEQENSFKTSNCWLLPGFNSLQKFKTHLGKNIDAPSNTKCTCAAKPFHNRHSYHHLQTMFGDSYSNELKIHHQPDCEFFKTSPKKSSSYNNDNWVLHKSKTNEAQLPGVSKAEDEKYLKPFNEHSLVCVQPKSLTNICGGKHIVYLPGQDGSNALNKDSINKNTQKQTKATMTTYKRQRQRQEIVRENLQDLTPLQSLHQSNAGLSEKNTHRFSFQSTVRVLEKRRLAEKLSKDAEIQEAQRLNELEVMKRVEEDFQRKRAPEKANLRNQLRLHLKANAENDEYRSLPLNINERYNDQYPQNNQISDVNNNIFCRADPDGAVSPSLDCNDNVNEMRHSNFPLLLTKNSKDLKSFDGEESKSEAQVPDLQCTALLIEPYMHSII